LSRVKPIPIAVIKRICTIARELPPNSFFLEAVADMIIIAFFFLLRPGEYTDSPSDTTPFTLGDVQLFIGPTRINLDTASDNEIRMARSASLTFTTLVTNGGDFVLVGVSFRHFHLLRYFWRPLKICFHSGIQYG
jgi:hypothetical protein